MTAVECYGDQHDLPKNEELRKVIVNLRDSSESSHQPSSSSSPQDFPEDPGLSVLIDTPEQSLRLHIQSARASKINRTAKMADQQDEPPPSGEVLAEQDTSPLEIVTKPDDRESKSSIDSGVGLDVSDLLPEKEQPDQVLPTKELATRTRSDSMQQAEQPCPRSDLGSPLRISLSTSNAGAAPPCEKDDSICASPTLSKHVIPSADIQGESLAPFEPLSPSASSPKAERLPSIHQITSSLTELAEAATQEMPRQQQNIAHHHSHSFGSATSQSPVLSNRPYPIAIQTSPQAYYPPTMLARSPTITIGESQYASPPPYASYGAYSHRRASAADAMPPLMPNLPTTSSSGDSYGGYLSSSTEGYSTNHTTPVDIGQVSESTPRPMLPPPPGMHAGSQPLPAPIMIPGPYKCDVPNCTAGTFQTQYLLNSHKNVHSQSRPHYCPVAGCPRSEGGKGFKRKNEMIRHGLVHNSPGYICPFCPEREHRYPRPDNLQRHVRVHHVNKDRDDNVLRDVLNQRTEGQGKTRRRRTNTGPMATGSL